MINLRRNSSRGRGKARFNHILKSLLNSLYIFDHRSYGKNLARLSTKKCEQDNSRRDIILLQ